MAEGRRKLEEAIQGMLASKQDAINLIPALVGRYNEAGAREVDVKGKVNFIHVRIYGQESEVWQVYNDSSYVEFGSPIYIVKDIANPRQFKVYGKNTGVIQSGIADKLLLKHGTTHSADTVDMTGKDPVWIYRRQMVQPLLCQPQGSPDLTVYVNADYYSWKNAFKYFLGGSSPNMASYKPAAGRAKYVTVYLAGDTNDIRIQDSLLTFDSTYPPSNTVDYIPSVDPSIGLALSSIKLTSQITGITWKDIVDVRIFLYTTTGANFGTTVNDVASSTTVGTNATVPHSDHVHKLNVSNPIQWDGTSITVPLANPVQWNGSAVTVPVADPIQWNGTALTVPTATPLTWNGSALTVPITGPIQWNGNALTVPITGPITWNGNALTVPISNPITWNGSELTVPFAGPITWNGNALTVPISNPITWNGSELTVPFAGPITWNGSALTVAIDVPLVWNGTNLTVAYAEPISWNGTALTITPNTFAPYAHVGSVGTSQHGVATASNAGFMPALSGDVTQVLSGEGTWITQSGGGGGIGHEHGVARWNASQASNIFILPDYAQTVESVTVGGLTVDPLYWLLDAVGDRITIDTPLTADSLVTANYVIKVI